MAVEPKDFLALAEDIATAISDEIQTRNAISRSYYASYHLAQTLYEALNISTHAGTKGGAHSSLITTLTTITVYQNNPHLDKELKSSLRLVGQALYELHEWRVWADYNLDMDIEPEQAETQIAKVKLCIQQCELLNPQQPPS